MRITVALVCAVHTKIIQTTGGLDGIRDPGMLESSVNSIYATFDSKELYPTIEDKATMLCFSLIKNHAFIDGNKRTGINIMHDFLMIHGKCLCVTDDELIELGLGVAKGRLGKEEIKSWIITHEIFKN